MHQVGYLLELYKDARSEKCKILGWRSCQLYVPAALYPQGISLVLISVETEWTSGLLNADGRNGSLVMGPFLLNTVKINYILCKV